MRWIDENGRVDGRKYVEWVVGNGQGGVIRTGEVDGLGLVGWVDGDRRGGWMTIVGVDR